MLFREWFSLRKPSIGLRYSSRDNFRAITFLIYINDLHNCLQYSQPRMYADDTNLSITSNSINNIEVKLNDDLVRVNEWLIANKLTLNSSKTKFMLIGSRQRLSTFQTVSSLSIGENIINQAKYTKSLAVFLDCNLSWNIHIDKLCKKIAKWHWSIEANKTFCILLYSTIYL